MINYYVINNNQTTNPGLHHEVHTEEHANQLGIISKQYVGYCANETEAVNRAKRIYSDARALTIYELLILSSLPLDWNIPEWASETFIRRVFGEGIPSKLVKEIVNQLMIQLRSENDG